MPYILAGFALSLLAVLAGLGVAAMINPLAYPDIRLVCRDLGEVTSACVSGAVEAGVVSAAGLVLAAIIAAGLGSAQQVRSKIPHELVLSLAVAAVVALLLVGFIAAPAAPFMSRQAEIASNASLVSIVNLGWPLLLQLAAVSPRLETRLGYLAALAALSCISPFRAALFAVLVFGVVLPICQFAVGRFRATRRFNLRLVAMSGGVLAAICLVVAAIIVLQTADRKLTPVDDVREISPVTTTLGKLAQRISYPLFQAHFASELARSQALPGALDEMAAKLRLGKSLGLNHYLYARIYDRDTAGETTSLYYGEAAARTSLSPLFWVIAGPLLYVLAWLLFSRLGTDVSTLAGVAIWRGSLGGAFSVLPAFLIQSLVMLLVARMAATRERARQPA